MPCPTTYVFDFDSTLLAGEALDAFGELVLRRHPNREVINSRIRTLTNKGMSGEIPFDVSLATRLNLFKAHRGHIPIFNAQLAAQLSPSAVAMKDWFGEHRDDIFVVSGGFEEFIIPTVAPLGILATNVYANAFTHDSDGNITGCDKSRLTAQAGGTAAQVAALALDGHVVMIGDGMTDLEVRDSGAADEFWAYTGTVARDGVVEQADRVLTSFADLRIATSSV